MTTSTLRKPSGTTPNTSTITRPNHDQDTDMTTFELDIDVAEPGLEPLAPDSLRPPGRDPDRSALEAPADERLDESLAARAPVARCADGNGTLAALFFSDHVADIARAKAMCALCPLSAGCLAGAIEREEPWGVWGGELLSGGRIIANKRPCGRPPKNPRPEIVYDEMGPVGVVA